jgi:hypothetical protein
MIAFAAGTWCAIEVAHLPSDRIDAGLSSYETLIEKAHQPPVNAGASVVFRSTDNRRVLALIEVGGHDAFGHLKAAWDAHHLNAERRAVAGTTSLALYRAAAGSGETAVDPTSHDTYAFEHVARDPQHVRALVPLAAASPGYVGALVFGADDERSSVVLYRFKHRAEIDAFRATPPALEILGAEGAPGESAFGVVTVKTFGGTV